MKPALTPEEWEKWTARGGFRSLERTLDDPNELYVRDTKNGVLVLPDAHFEYGIRGRARHALAALALHGLVVDGKPVGFTRAMLSALESALRYDMTPEEVDQCRALAARIETLLPPEAK